mmetsp:Transcript_7422/g.27746  ORF Transcript_7422/g.27746 Transcript_7422/m.27746 type:complete len:121 (+) Transcript_7422:2203-2565(+)
MSLFSRSKKKLPFIISSTKAAVKLFATYTNLLSITLRGKKIKIENKISPGTLQEKWVLKEKIDLEEWSTDMVNLRESMMNHFSDNTPLSEHSPLSSLWHSPFMKSSPESYISIVSRKHES